jgi:hypothetical protein
MVDEIVAVIPAATVTLVPPGLPKLSVLPVRVYPLVLNVTGRRSEW